ncbi:hypothetical protein OPV22_013755 [Ensete ventricosum]|uniref:Uncharacterized protein n=1 Tax=Ensete ventricosum TaxID=4639 RepID=A0AAV8PNU2_ENSVE|nr:hypothetical protein OPV22_013755 [Ensete ventricosum]
MSCSDASGLPCFAELVRAWIGFCDRKTTRLCRYVKVGLILSAQLWCCHLDWLWSGSRVEVLEEFADSGSVYAMRERF